jgi:hypothetical protein
VEEIDATKVRIRQIVLEVGETLCPQVTTQVVDLMEENNN